MGFRRADLQEAFFVPGTYPFRVWGYGTTDPLAEVLRPDYFRSAGSLLHPGELIYVSTRPRRDAAGREVGELRAALVMVNDDRSAPSVRLVQDFGAAGSAPAKQEPAPTVAAGVPVRRRRGRPPGSRTRRRAAAPAPAPAPA